MENPFEENKMKRPTFLTVLCILTFIGSGWGIISQLFSLFTAGMVDSNVQMEQYSNMVENMENSGAASFLSGFLSSTQEVLQATLMHAREMAVINLVLSLISLGGAILMFNLKRVGFYGYAVAQVLMLFVTPYFAGFSMLVISGMLLSAVFAILFIILYSLNLKYMR